jgi:hypothetical protein
MWLLHIFSVLRRWLVPVPTHLYCAPGHGESVGVLCTKRFLVQSVTRLFPDVDRRVPVLLVFYVTRA